MFRSRLETKARISKGVLAPSRTGLTQPTTVLCPLLERCEWASYLSSPGVCVCVCHPGAGTGQNKDFSSLEVGISQLHPEGVLPSRVCKQVSFSCTLHVGIGIAKHKDAVRARCRNAEKKCADWTGSVCEWGVLELGWAGAIQEVCAGTPSVQGAPFPWGEAWRGRGPHLWQQLLSPCM